MTCLLLWVEYTFYRATACNATHGIAKTFLSVRLSVCLSNAWMVTKRKKLVPTFLYHMNEHSPSFLTRRMVGERIILPEILGQSDPVGAKMPIFNRYSRVAPQP